jgi:hypothetical protein
VDSGAFNFYFTGLLNYNDAASSWLLRPYSLRWSSSHTLLGGFVNFSPHLKENKVEIKSRVAEFEVRFDGKWA